MPPQAPVSVPLNASASALLTAAIVPGGGTAITFTATFTAAGTYTWTDPAGVIAANTQCWAGGGNGGGSNTGTAGSGGGGGEFASEPANTVTPGNGYTVVVGTAGAAAAEGTANNGGNSSFTGAGATTVTANGGHGNTGNTGTGSAGGTGSTNTVRHNGGPGGGNNGAGAGGGGGGGSGGTASAGNTGGAGVGATPGAGATAVANGGPGGAGAATTAPGNAPATGPGGGGGAAGGSGTQNGGAGWAGQAAVIWTMPNTATISSATTGGVYTVTAPAGSTGVAWTITGTANFNGNAVSGSSAVTAGNSYTFSVGAAGAIVFIFSIPSAAGTLGGSIAQIGPINQREVWSPESISVSASSNVLESTCRIYIGTDVSQPNFVASTLMGSTGFITYPTANLLVRPGEYVWAVWNGGDIGAQGRLNVQGTRQMGSGGPPAWKHR